MSEMIFYALHKIFDFNFYKVYKIVALTDH